ncbi:hypothetical protein ASE36_10665 [Rhizobium sp. Root274]|nr:hypothetical protein ASE36_10665 [Rhizobium sp. Root274]
MPAKRLDHLDIDVSGSRRVVLKIEAEGAEPEVLEGATGILANVDYVTIDCGFERGKERADTFAATNTFLADQGFRMMKPNFKRMIMLYCNMDRVSQVK